MKGVVLVILVIIFVFCGYLLLSHSSVTDISVLNNKNTLTSAPTKNPDNTFPLAISAITAKNYPGSSISIVQTLPDGTNYYEYLTSYKSEGLTIYALLTVPKSPKPTGGYPAIILNHGYIPPNQYSTTQSYAVMVTPLAENGYVVFKPDYRGNGNSEGTPTQVYVSSDYVTDSLNAVESLKQMKDFGSDQSLINPNKVGVLGHSMGGNITLRELIIKPKEFKVAVILAGVVGNYSDILDWWKKRVATGVLTTQNDKQTATLVQNFVKQHGTPQTNPSFWQTIDPTGFISNIFAPVEIQVGTADTDVPPSFSSELYQLLKNNDKTVEFYSYSGADHNLNPDESLVFQRGIAFFDKYLK